jgi:hypothetical protein
MCNLSRIGAFVGVAIVLVLAACESGDALGPDTAQGIEGLALLGPQCPVEILEDPCPDLPHQAWIDVLNDDGGFVTRVQSGDDGRFRVGVRPGSYVLDPKSGNPFPFASEMDVEVREGLFTQVTVHFDTGIR